MSNNRAYDKELRDPKLIKSILKLGKKAKKDYYKGKITKVMQLNRRG